MPASRAASSRGRPSSALASASRRALTHPSRSRRARRRSSAGSRSGRIGKGAGTAAPPGRKPPKRPRRPIDPSSVRPAGMKKRVRGVRPIERAAEGRDDAEAEAVRGYCAAVRSAITDDGRPPLAASGLKLEGRLEAGGARLRPGGGKGGGRASRGALARLARAAWGLRLGGGLEAVVASLAGVGERGE